MNRRGTAPARQKRGVNVHATQSRDRQHIRGKNQTVCDDDHDVGTKRCETLDRFRIAKRRRLFDRQRMPERALLDGAHGELLAAARRSIGLRVDRNDAMSRCRQRLQRRHREFRRTGEDDGKHE